MNKITAHLFILMATIIVAGSFVVIKELAGSAHPISLSLMRFFFATLLLAPAIMIRKGCLVSIKKLLPRSATISFFFCCYFICNFAALETSSSLNIGSIYTLTPFITALLSIVIFKQYMSVKLVIAYTIAAVGTTWIVFNGDIQAILALSLNSGDIVFFIGVFFMSGYTMSMKLLYQQDDVVIMTFCNLLCGTIWMLIAALVLNIELNWSSFPTAHYTGMSYLIIGATLVTSYLFQKASTVLTPNNITAYIYLTPAIVALINLIGFNGKISLTVWVGITTTLLATTLIQFTIASPRPLKTVQKNK